MSLWTPGGEREVPRDAPAEQLGPDEEIELEGRLAELRDQLAHTPVAAIVAQLAYQFFEVAALHLSLQPPNLDEAQLAIDAMAALVEGLGARLADNAAPLKDGLSQIRMAYVQIKDAGSGAPPPSAPDAPGQPGS